MKLQPSFKLCGGFYIAKRLPLLLLLVTFAAAQGTQRQTPESVSAQLIRDVKSACERQKKRDPSYYQLPPPNEQLVYVLNGKKYSHKALLEISRQSQITSCSTDEIEVTFTGSFPSSAMVTARFLKEGVFPGTQGKTRVFSVYARYMYEFADSKWIVRKLDAITAK